MNLNIETILEKFAHVFKNEFNERKILHTAIDDSWGKRVAYELVSGTGFVVSDRTIERANSLRDLSRTLVLTEDKNGYIQLFNFWLDFTRNVYGYSEIERKSLYIPNLVWIKRKHLV